MLAFLLEAALRSFLVGSVLWVAIGIAKVRGTQIEESAWKGVLLVSLAMPLFMRLSPIVIWSPSLPIHISPLPGLLAMWLLINILRAHNHAELIAWVILLAASLGMQLIVPFSAAASDALAMPTSVIFASRAETMGDATITGTISSWPSILTAVYLAVAIVLMLRLLTGLITTWRLCRRSSPADGGAVSGCALRVSPDIAAPVTFGSTILIPKGYQDWSLPTLNAVLAHEGAHVRRRDFLMHILAAVGRCLFWFSPFAWFLESRLTLLAEIASDNAAMSEMDDRAMYAKLLLEFAARKSPQGAIGMARPNMIAERIDRVISNAGFTRQLSKRGRYALNAVLVALVAGTVAISPSSQMKTPRFEPIGVGRSKISRLIGCVPNDCIASGLRTRAGAGDSTRK